MSYWLNTTFSGFDYAILNSVHKFAKLTDESFNLFFKGVSLLAEKGVVLLLIAIILMLFKRTRKVGICMFGAIGLGAIITNLWLKDVVARARPYTCNHDFWQWWVYAGQNVEKDFSFPSGHTTAAMASMMAVFLTCNKKYSWTAFIFTFIIAFSRLYLVVHYPSDVCAGILVGLISGTAAYFITKLIYNILEKNKENKFCNFCLNFNLGKKINSGN